MENLETMYTLMNNYRSNKESIFKNHMWSKSNLFQSDIMIYWIDLTEKVGYNFNELEDKPIKIICNEMNKWMKIWRRNAKKKTLVIARISNSENMEYLCFFKERILLKIYLKM